MKFNHMSYKQITALKLSTQNLLTWGVA